MKKFLSVCVSSVLIAGGVATPGALASESLYAITFQNQLLTIDVSTGAGTLVGNLDSTMAGFGLADRSGRLYTFDQEADRVRELDPFTGATLNTIDIGVSTVGEGAIAFRSDGVGFLARSSGFTGQLWQFDLTVPGSIEITADDGLNPSMDGMDFDGSDVLYGMSQFTADLYTINQSTGATTLLGGSGLTNVVALQGLSFNQGGDLYAAINDSLYSIDPSTGHATHIGAIGFVEVSGLSFLEPVPEPGTAALIGVGALALLSARRRT